MAKKLKKAELEQYFAWKQEKLAAQRLAADRGKMMAEFEDRALEYVQENGGPERAVMSCGYRLAINEENGSVSWKKEFLRVAGQEEAERLVQEAPKKDVLVIEPPA